MRVGIIGNPGRFQNSFAMSTEALWKANDNTGNLAFRYAVANQITSEKVFFSWNSDPALVRESCDLLVFPSANGINPNTDKTHSRKADFVEAVDLPCVVVGLGAQAPSLDHELKLNKGTERWLHAIAKRSKLIGVRGEYTANVFAKIGIKNTIVLGCPSLLINPNPRLGEMIEKKLHQAVPQNLVVTAGMPGRMPLRRVERKLINLLRKYNGVYVVQAPQYLVSLAREGKDAISEEHLDNLHWYLQPRISRYCQSRSEFIKFIRRHFRVFFDASTWIEFLSSFDMAIGTRMHGNMLAVQAGTPGICIYHDSRTQELCSVTGIPHISTSKFINARNIREVRRETSFNGKAFDKNRARIAREYKSLLTKNGIDISENLDSIIGDKVISSGIIEETH